MSWMLWRHRAERWDQEGSTQLSNVVEAVVAACGDTDGAVAVDLGCGSGQVTFPLAPRCAHILAVDIDERAIAILEERAKDEGITNIQAIAHPVETLELDPESVDLVVSNYALHHLRDADKRQVIERSFRWLRPGGRLVIGDMMFGRGADSADRQIIWKKIRDLAVRGPGGWWRIVKNSYRFIFRFQEKPLVLSAWESIVREAGFVNVASERVVAEACVVSAIKEAPQAPPSGNQIGAGMRSGLPLAALAAVALCLTACGGSSSSTGTSSKHRAGARPQIYRATLSGTGGGAKGGAGAAVIALHGSSKICWRFAHLHGFVGATGARIDAGANGKPKPVLTLSTGSRLHHHGCVRASRSIVSAIRHNPHGYYVDIASRQYPAGAVRARL
jgi:ubiquinone/menaquinone biosynthesis C-methylase UbiE